MLVAIDRKVSRLIRRFFIEDGCVITTFPYVPSEAAIEFVLRVVGYGLTIGLARSVV